MARWIKSHVLHLVTAVLASLLVSAVVGTWTATVEFQRLQERLEQRDAQYEQRFRQHEQNMNNLRRRVRWLEQNRRTEISFDGYQ